jgi:hypothetical protein
VRRVAKKQRATVKRISGFGQKINEIDGISH